ncbi:helix-turn-helix domain-containing protein [bacterium]|jgi:HTH-type transcriptional regulator / antitoxin HipB|nr:helix-turn-helix domain-containing protein [bacterium]
MKQVIRNSTQLGKELSRLRHKQALTQKELGELVSLRQATISALENGNPGTRLQTLFDILSALNLELSVKERTVHSKESIEEIF